MNSKPLNILLADDDTDDCIFFQKALKEIPITTHLTIVNDGEQLMEYLLNEVSAQNVAPLLPDILFLDLSMPRKTGYECLSEIKQNIQLKEIPVVVFSTSYPENIKFEKHEEDLINMVFKIGASDYVRKPDNFSQFKLLVHNALIKVTEKNALIPKEKIKV